MIEPAMARCGRTAAIVGAMLDGDEGAMDRAHIAACPTCRRETDRVLGFDRDLASAAAVAGDTIPEPAAVRIRRPNVRLAPLAALIGAVAVGLVIAAVIGSRSAPSIGDGRAVFEDTARAEEALAPLGLDCRVATIGVVCEATAPDHIHRAVLTVDDGRVVGVEMAIESTDGGPLNLSGASDYLARIAAAVLTPEAATAADSWIREAYSTCGASCSTDLDAVSLTMTRDSRAVGITLRDR